MTTANGTHAIDYPAASAPTALDDELRAANMNASQLANQANAVTGIYGISGVGKSGLADTAAEYCYEKFGKITLCYAADLGGFGNKRLTLIRQGIMRVYDPQNHVDPFATMELLSLGAFPAVLIDPERGYADPNVPLILPRRFGWSLICPQEHVVKTFETEAALQAVSLAGGMPCPSCGVVTHTGNCRRIDKVIVRHKMFANVGLRIYDSITSLNDWGLLDLQQQSALGTLPKSSSGGSLLGAADALQSGQFRFGSSSEGQYGFLQNRSYGWLRNIRTIPDQAVPAIATFHVGMSKEAKGVAGGGDLQYGPKIAGDARTATIPGWLGNCLHATTEPYSTDDQTLVFRLWLTNHIDPRDQRRIPYIAKHRGTPLGMPKYLEDAPGAEPWSGFSLAVFFAKLQDQLTKLEAQAKSKYPNAPGMWTGAEEGDAADEIVGAATGATGVGGVGGGLPTAAGTPITITGSGSGGRGLRRGRSAAGPSMPSMPVAPMPPMVPIPLPAPQQTSTTVTASAGGTPVVTAGGAPTSPALPVEPSAPSLGGTPSATGGVLTGAPPLEVAGSSTGTSTQQVPTQQSSMPSAPTPTPTPQPPPPAPAATPAMTTARPLRRARPPV